MRSFSILHNNRDKENPVLFASVAQQGHQGSGKFPSFVLPASVSLSPCSQARPLRVTKQLQSSRHHAQSTTTSRGRRGYVSVLGVRKPFPEAPSKLSLTSWVTITLHALPMSITGKGSNTCLKPMKMLKILLTGWKAVASLST